MTINEIRNEKIFVENTSGWANGSLQDLNAIGHKPGFKLQPIVTQRRGHYFMLTHDDGRGWIFELSMNAYGTWVSFCDYKSKKGYWKPATDANSCAYDKLREKLLA